MFRQIAFGAATAAVFALAPVAQAADLPAYEPAPAVAAPGCYDWSGPYVGAQTGYSWGHALKTDAKGWMVGGYAGYNVMLDCSNPVVFGIDTDFNWTNIDDKKGGRKASSDWNGATRGRIGYAFDRFLVYGAAGVAYSDREVRVSGNGGDSKSAVGWTVGGGVEYAVADDVTIRGEYRYNDYGHDNFDLNRGSVRSKYTDHRAMIGVAYKFSGF